MPGMPGIFILIQALIAMFKSVFALSLALLLWVAPAAAQDQRVAVSPIRVEFAQGKTTAILTIVNDRDAAVSIQPTAVEWKQESGTDVNSPTRDLLVAPPMVEIPPNTRQTIRVALRATPAQDTEKTYRILLREVPKIDAQGNQTTLRFAMTFSIPVFVPPAQGLSEQRLQASAIWFPPSGQAPGKLAITLRNTGNAHAKITKLAIGSESQASLIYVLQGSERKFDLTWPTQPPALLAATFTTERGLVQLDIPVQRAK
jgi:fimbrial chaperone protein